MSDFFGKKIKELGFGLMRLPVIPGGEQKDIDFDQVQKMVDLFMERGYSYFDTAYLYHNGIRDHYKECLVINTPETPSGNRQDAPVEYKGQKITKAYLKHSLNTVLSILTLLPAV